jgi:hypothetical protein
MKTRAGGRATGARRFRDDLPRLAREREASHEGRAASCCYSAATCSAGTQK